MYELRNARYAVETQTIIEQIFGSELHKKHQLSLSYAAMGVLGSGTLIVMQNVGKSNRIFVI